MPRILYRGLAALLVAGAAFASAAGAQTARPPAPFGPPDAGPFSGGVPSGQPTAEALALTLADALSRGLRHNLGVLSREQDVEGARGARWRALSAVLPQVSGRLSEQREVINLAAFGFNLPGIPMKVGPFNVFDARIAVSQSVLDASELFRLREQNQALEADRHAYRNARDLVVLAVANLYLQGIAADSRVAAARAQLETAEALARLAGDRRQSGLVAGIDVLRAQVQLETERQRLIVAENAAAKQRLVLARAIGLPVGQAFSLADPMPSGVTEPPALDQAVAQATVHREDLRGLEARVRAAEEGRRAARAERLPSLRVDASYGTIGPSVATAFPTYAMAANVRVPLFNNGPVQAHAIEADATLKRREAELADARARVTYELQAALLDLRSAQQQVEVSARTVTLAERQLAQARDRFSAGVADTIEVVQAQETLAGAHDNRIASLYGYNAAKAALAGALGVAEEEMPRFLGGSR